VGFEPDNKIQQVAEAYAEDAIELAGKQYGLKLDWTDESVKHIEAILASLYGDIPNAKPTDEQIFQFAKAWAAMLARCFEGTMVRCGAPSPSARTPSPACGRIAPEANSGRGAKPTTVSRMVPRTTSGTTTVS
jgi:hypothetical protein